MSRSINLWHEDLFSVSFSNIPTITNPEDINLLEQFIKSVNFPEYSNDNEDSSAFIGFRGNQLIGHDLNRTIALLQIEFKIDEGFFTYLSLWKWLWNIKYGQNINTEKLRDYVCKEISINIFDNMKRLQGRFAFTRANVVNISAIPMNFGTGNETTFTAMFSYEEHLWLPEDIPQCNS